MLRILTRCPGAGIGDVESAFYEDRSIVRMLGFRRTSFAVDWALVPAVRVSSGQTVVRDQHR